MQKHLINNQYLYIKLQNVWEMYLLWRQFAYCKRELFCIKIYISPGYAFHLMGIQLYKKCGKPRPKSLFPTFSYRTG